jgi:hypothetical protein
MKPEVAIVRSWHQAEVGLYAGVCHVESGGDLQGAGSGALKALETGTLKRNRRQHVGRARKQGKGSGMRA